VSEPNPEQPKGICFVETKSLDGETNLKMRTVLPYMLKKVFAHRDLASIRGKVECEHPNNRIDDFTGTFECFEDHTHHQHHAGADGAVGQPHTVKSVTQHGNIALRGCVLRSTDWMIGLVLNTGHDVKIMQGDDGSSMKPKSSLLENMASEQIYGVLMLLLIISMGGATGQVS
jgi:magnesium-transporting ATPase (P-type)